MGWEIRGEDCGGKDGEWCGKLGWGWWGNDRKWGWEMRVGDGGRNDGEWGGGWWGK